MLFSTFKNNSQPDRQTDWCLYQYQLLCQPGQSLLTVCVCVNACICVNVSVCVCVQLQTVPLCAHHDQTPCFLSCYDPETAVGPVCATLCRVQQTASPLTSSLWDGEVAAVTGDGAEANDGGHWQCVWHFVGHTVADGLFFLTQTYRV